MLRGEHVHLRRCFQRWEAHDELAEQRHYVARSYAPCGTTPVPRPHLTRARLSVMSGVTPRGRLYTLTRRPLRSAECIAFLGHVRRMVGGKLLAVWDGSPIRRSQEVKAFPAGGGAQFVRREKLPAYAPGLNPDEG